jgi:hypothetical protein
MKKTLGALNSRWRFADLVGQNKIEVKAAQNCFRNCERDFRGLAVYQGYIGEAIKVCNSHVLAGKNNSNT